MSLGCRSESGTLPEPKKRECFLCNESKSDFFVKRYVDLESDNIYQVCNDCVIRLLRPFL